MSISIPLVILPKPLHYHHLHTFGMRPSKPIWLSSSTTAPGYSFRATCSSTQIDLKPSVEVRRSGNYRPTLWDFTYLQSLNSPYKEKRHLNREAELIVNVKTLLNGKTEAVKQLELIDDLQNLGLSYFFSGGY